MKELREILARARALRAAQVPAAVATIVAVEGSSYRREGARMLIEPGGAATGVLSGGCVERELAQVAAEVAAGGTPRVVVFDLTGDDEAIWGFGLGCSGRVTLLVEPLSGAGGEALERALGAAIEDRRNVSVATVYASAASSVAIGGRHFCFEAKQDRNNKDKGAIEGKDEETWRRVAEELLIALPRGSARSARLQNLDGAEVQLLLESLVPPVQLVIFGAERDVVPLARLGGEMGWDVVVVDSRQTEAAVSRFTGLARYLAAAPRDLRAARRPALALDARTAVVVATHRYLDDLAFLAELATVEIGYLGLLGPGPRRQRLLGDLERQGVRLDRSRLHGPAGLALGGRTPAEVALAIVAEIQAELHGGSGAPLARSASAAGELTSAAPSADASLPSPSIVSSRSR